MDLVQLVNSADEEVGVLDKVKAHEGEGVLHRAISVFLFNSQNELLIQQRSDQKITAKLLWANTCCGNVRPGETYQQCAVRRLREELGIENIRLSRLGVFEYHTAIDSEFSEYEMDTVFIAHADVHPKMDPAEVAACQWIPWEKFVTLVRSDEAGVYAPWVAKILEHFGSQLNFPFDQYRAANSNCENVVGSVSVPLGSAGPIAIRGELSLRDAYLPLATTEGALIASVSRGIKALNADGGAMVFVNKVGMSRAPVFACQNGVSAFEFCEWLQSHTDDIAALAESTSHHLKFLTLQTWVRGRLVFARCGFDPDEAMGMNMVSIALEKWIESLRDRFPDVKCVSLSSNVCTDKKDAGINRLYGRGYWVQAEIFLTKETIEDVLHTTSRQLLETFEAKCHVGTNLAQSFSQNMQVANVVSAVYLATGQDLAHVVDASSGSMTVEPQDDGLYVALTLPSIIVGTVGGGTWLPAQVLARNMIKRNCTSKELAAAIGAGCLAGEISGLSALSTNTLAKAHASLGRIDKPL